MIAWLVIATVLGVLAGLATHACADAADPEKRQLRADYDQRVLLAEVRIRCDIRVELAQRYREVAQERQRLEAWDRKLKTWEMKLHGGESIQTALDRINAQLKFINERLNAVDGGYGFLLGREEDPT